MRQRYEYSMPPADPLAAELRIYGRAWRRLQRAEIRACRAVQDAGRAHYFHRSDPACEEARARYILARAAMRDRIAQLARRRADFDRAESLLAPLLRMRQDEYTRRQRAMKTPKHAGSLDDVRIDTIRNWDNHDTCHYCRLNGAYRDSTHVLIGIGFLSGTEHSFGLCADHAVQSLEYTQYESLDEAIAATAARYSAVVDAAHEG